MKYRSVSDDKVLEMEPIGEVDYVDCGVDVDKDRVHLPCPCDSAEMGKTRGPIGQFDATSIVLM